MMSFKQNLIRARSHIVFIVALLTAFGIVITLENINFENRVSPKTNIKDVVELERAPLRELTAQEMDWAKLAWTYFQNNTIPETGMVNSVDNYTASTLWDSASYMMAVISAHRLQIIDDAEFTQRTNKLLDSFATLPLYEGKLPNKSYNTQTLDMVDYNNNSTEKGIGWSAIDIGRVMVPLNVLIWNYPQFTPKVKAISKNWDLAASVKDGDMYGATNEHGETEYVQEGRLGYEEYAAKTYQLMGYDVSNAIDYTAWLNFVDIYGINVPTDSRSPDQFTAHNYVVSEPYILDGIEFGWDQVSQEFAERVFQVQQERYKDTGILTAVSEDNIDQAPYFVYNTVYTSGKTWNAITEDGEDASEFKTLSTKAAFGWHALFENDYTKKLMEKVSQLNDPEKGWYSGLYEKTGEPNKAITANTNGIILETLAYKQFGPLLKP
jgi:hypothetical protein